MTCAPDAARSGLGAATLLVAAIAAATSLAAPATSQRPTNVWILGDSTVRNRTDGQMGWGDPLVAEFDPARAEVHNRAIGGRSSRTFRTEGRWAAVLENARPGDFVLLQFGHNDGGSYFDGSRPRASIKGNGDETVEGTVERTGANEVVHSYGWYLRQYCAEARTASLHPIVLSPIPRNRRDEHGRIHRADRDYAKWAREAAEQSGASFVDLNAVLAARFDELGQDATDALFCGTDHTHTSPAGARYNARVVADELRRLPGIGALLRAPDLWLPALFRDHAVLQRDLPIAVWGRARPAVQVTVELAGRSIDTTADARGAWRVELAPLAGGGPHRMTVTAGAARRVVDDVMIGEVWLCAGQSNMEFTVAKTERCPYAGVRDAEQVLQNADEPRIRVFTVERALREAPQPDVHRAWRVSSRRTVPEFSAVAWLFGRGLFDALDDVPVGLLVTAHGASTAEAWISPQRLLAEPTLAPLVHDFERERVRFRDAPERLADYGRRHRQWLAATERDGSSAGRAPRHPDPARDQHSPGVLFHGMLSPLLGYGVRGVLWYQGESNIVTRELYTDLQRALLEDLRERTGRPELPFYFVQLPGYRAPKHEPADSSWASMRQAQARTLALPQTGMAVTIDVGEADDVHPRDKQTVAERLLRLALVRTYGHGGAATGPTLRSARREGNAVRLVFDHVHGGLVAAGGALRHFALAGVDGTFVWADAKIDGDDVVLRSDAVAAPQRVRYAWADNPTGANLQNAARLPAAPFDAAVER